MTYETVLGQPAVFRMDGASGALDGLTVRERRLVVGALNFHALMAPARTLTAHLYANDADDLPRTTDDSTFDGASRRFRYRIASEQVTSLVADEDRTRLASESGSRELVEHASRHIHVSYDRALLRDPVRGESMHPLRRLSRVVRRRWPLVYDEMRDLELRRFRSELVTPADRHNYRSEFDAGGIHEGGTIVPVAPAPAGATRAVLIGVHWFELGGAERWAFESVKLVREAGLLPIVISNRDSHQPWLSRPELDGALIIPFSEPTVESQTPGVEQLLRAVLGHFDVRGVVVHHNQWLYDRLGWIRESRPEVPIVDTTHIIEYRGGGFPLASVRADTSVTTHHVISPSLAAWMTQAQGVAANKVVMAPLGGLTVDGDGRSFKRREHGEEFTVAFVGRMARQKAPEVFVTVAEQLRRRVPGIRFIMHGEGELASWVDRLVASRGLSDVVTRRDSRTPVADTLRAADVLAVTAHNEGLTLTSLEAISAGVPVVSTDVGAQSDIVPARALASRNVHRAVTDLTRIIVGLAGDEDARRVLWSEEDEKMSRLLDRPSATEWFSQEVAKW